MASGTLAKTLVGVLVGGGATMAVGYAGSKVETIAKYPIITPALLIGIGLLLARRGRLVAGFALIGAGGAILGLQALVKLSTMQQQKPAQTAGAGGGDRLTDSGGTFGNKGVLEQQNAMGDLDGAGALFGYGARSMLAAQDAMGGFAVG